MGFPSIWQEINVSRETFILLFKEGGLCYLLVSRPDGDGMGIPMTFNPQNPKKTNNSK
jgi:hypothetical protein